MTILIAGVVLFVGVHSLAIVGLRERGVAMLGEGPWKGIYSLIALVGLVAMIYGYGAARMTPMVLYLPPVWTRHLALLLMVPVFPLIFAAYLPGRIRTFTGHPMMLGTIFWALAHLIANGMLADVVLFGGLLLWAVIERISLSMRPQRPIATAPAGPFNDIIALIAGLGTYTATLLWLHAWLIGIPPVVFG